MLRGDVYLADLSPTKESEQAGKRPVVVVSRDAINQSSPVVIAVPITGLEHKTRIYPSQVRLNAGTGGLSKDSVVLGEQVRAISKGRLTKRLGRLTADEMRLIATALKVAMDLP
ncbi:MAG TPA: type II toxin-antitoxin system PemK/MazF family toxin [Terriglobia bacterium]|nr:type II toxin-antitoxin system PemK/MazF family toxin [Terriglobia bacterium]